MCLHRNGNAVPVMFPLSCSMQPGSAAGYKQTLVLYLLGKPGAEMIVELNSYNTCSKNVPPSPDRAHVMMDSPTEASKQQTERLTGFQAPGFSEDHSLLPTGPGGRAMLAWSLPLPSVGPQPAPHSHLPSVSQVASSRAVSGNVSSRRDMVSCYRISQI